MNMYTAMVLTMLILIPALVGKSYIESNERIAKYEVDAMYEKCEVTDEL